MPNRFSQIVQPYVANPIDVNMFAMVPMAKARAKALGIKAAESYMFDYNIDQKDAAYINPLVKGVTDQKDAIVNRVRTEGVSNDLVGDLIQTKRNYDKVQTDVRKAEENKKRIDAWNNKLLVLHKNNPTYMDFVKNEEYGRGWSGTFGENGSINTFDASYGPQYFDMTAGYTNALKGIRMELDKETSGGGYITTITDPNTGHKRSMFVSSQGTKTFSNKSKVLAQLDILKEKYKDPTTTEGAYANYIGMTDAAIDKMGENIANNMIQTEIQKGNISRRLLPPTTVTPPPGDDIEEPFNPADKPPGNVFEVKTKTEVGYVQELNDFNKDKLVKNTVYHLYDLPSAAFEEFGNFGERYAEAKESGSWWDSPLTYFFKAHSATWDRIRERKGKTDIEMDKFNEMSTAKKEAYTKRFVDKFSMDYMTKEGINLKFSNNWSEENGFPIVKKDIVEQEFDKTAGALIFDKGRGAEGNEALVEGIVDFSIKSSDTKRAYSFNQSESSPFATTKGFKNNPKAYIEYFATQADMFTGNLAVKNLATGKLINPSTKKGQDLLKKINQAMRNFSGAAGKDPNGLYNMDFPGVGTSEPGLYNVYDENTGANIYSEKLAYGAKIRVFETGEKGEKAQIGQFLIGNTPTDRGTKEFQDLSRPMEQMGNLKDNEVLEGTFFKRVGLDFKKKSYKKVPVEIHRNTFERQGLDNKGNLVIIPRDQLMYYIQGEELPRWYNAADIKFFNIPKNAKPRRSGKYGLKEVADNIVSTMSPEVFTRTMNNTTKIWSNHGPLY